MANREYSDDGWGLAPPVAKPPPVIYRGPPRSAAEPPAFSIVHSQPEPVRQSVLDNGLEQIVAETTQRNYSCIPDIAFAREQVAKKPASVTSDHYLVAENQQESIRINQNNFAKQDLSIEESPLIMKDPNNLISSNSSVHEQPVQVDYSVDEQSVTANNSSTDDQSVPSSPAVTNEQPTKNVVGHQGTATDGLSFWLKGLLQVIEAAGKKASEVLAASNA